MRGQRQRGSWAWFVITGEAELARLPDQHLNLYELALLVPDQLPRETQARLSDAERFELEEHLRGCIECQQLLEQEQFLLRMSKRAPLRGTPDAGCPSPEQWMDIVAGLDSPARTQEKLDHATHCASCCAQLKQLAEQFADETTEEEKRILTGLASATPEWQQNLATRMQAASFGENSLPSAKVRSITLPQLRFGIAAAVAALTVLLVSWFAYFRPSAAVDRLLVRAYSEQRTSDLRVIGAPYAAVKAFRGSESPELRAPTALLEAEVLISRELSTKPDDPSWLDAQGRADLMESNYLHALSSLERAHRYEPDNDAILIDLASAYFLRGEKLKRSEDYGRSVDLLGQVLSRNPRNEIARFNRAIASERLHLYEQAAEDWKRYLEIDPHSGWSDEARKRLQDLQGKMNSRREQNARPLLGPAEFLAAVAQHKEVVINDLDLHLERYFEVAVRQWVPAAFLGPPGSDARNAREALEGFSRMLISKHQDYWLSDFLDELQHKPSSQVALHSLQDSLRFNEMADFGDARKSAAAATVSFRKTGNAPGALMAQFQSSYSDQLAHQASDCLAEACARADPHVAQRYPWLRIQLDLESAICTNLNDELARRLAQEAFSLAKQHRYPSLELRATTFLADLYQYMGDVSSGWRYATDGLTRYWEGDFPLIRGYSLYAELDYIAESSEEWFLDAQVLAEGSQYQRGDPDLEVQALRSYRFANALAMTGDLHGAERSINEGRDLFLRSADSTRKNSLEFEAQVALAKAELLCSHPVSVIHRLEPLEPVARTVTDTDLAFDYFRNLGLAYFAIRDTVRAKQALSTAVRLAEQSLARNPDERERLIWCRKTDRVYRALVQLSLAGPADVAFSQWEWFKGASVRGAPEQPSNLAFQSTSLPSERAVLPQLVPPADTLVVSYALLPGQTIAWTFSRAGVQQHALSISEHELDLLAHRFVDHCSRPDSNLATVRTESHLLYAKLLEPFEASLRGYKHLLIEPDQALWFVPFAALLDRDSVYLGDLYSLSLSPGLNYLNLSLSSPGVSDRSPILIAADPPSRGRTPLGDAEQEAKGIARQFRFKRLLLEENTDYRDIAEQMKDVEIFHFSGHAVASPDGVGLVLGESGVMDVDTIRVSDIAHLRLVVLSACNTANGTDAVFDDYNSLARLLIGAGVLNVVASRWSVDSRATKTLMEDFYAQLVSGAEVSSALRQASRRLRGDEEFQHPFYWASFSAFGKG